MAAGSVRERGVARWLPLASGGGILLGLAVPVGCSGAGSFDCSDASQCSAGGQAGTCEPSGYCSFPDESCASGQRYGEHAAAGIAGTCVPVQDATAGSTATGDGPSTIEGSATGTGMASTADPVADDSTSVASTAALDTSEPTTMAPGSTSSTTGDASSGSSGGSTTGAPLTVLNHQAALAECNDPINLDPEVCKDEASPSPAALLVDLDDTAVGPFHGYLRFDLDGAVDPGLVVSVTLRMTVTSVSSSASSGAVYLVEPFELMDLYAIQPAPIGPALAPDQGAVAGNDVVEWSLPPDLLPLGEPSLYLGILAQSTDGVDYWNLAGAQPPELVVEQQE
jgi:hypothetical protein